jgi:1-acyl-sn-glycerol-3-phosphate acyltransferase
MILIGLIKRNGRCQDTKEEGGGMALRLGWTKQWKRRAVSLPAYFILWLFVCGLLPVWLVLSFFVDLVRRVKFATTRTLLFFALYLTCEMVGLLVSGVLWCGKWVVPPIRKRYEDLHFRLQWWWAGMLWQGVCYLFSLRVSVQGQDCVKEGPYLFFIRHSSVADTLLASVFVAAPFRMKLRYVLKQELLWDPCLDVVGHRIPNAFIGRSAAESEQTLATLRELVSDVQGQEGVLIYPEGTRFTPGKRKRLLDKFTQEQNEEAHRRTAAMSHVLPPRPKGSLALITERPDLDVVFCVHSGFERVTSFWHIWSGAPIGDTISLGFWRVPATSIPAEENDRKEWLYEQWTSVEEWVAERAERVGG